MITAWTRIARKLKWIWISTIVLASVTLIYCVTTLSVSLMNLISPDSSSIITYLSTSVDWRIRPLALVVKLWANFHSINDARNSTISSYSLVLMVIHFLQYAVKPAVLPCLHKLMPEKFNQLHDITTINMVEKCDLNWKSENHQSLGELFLRFLDYYTNFEWVESLTILNCLDKLLN